MNNYDGIYTLIRHYDFSHTKLHLELFGITMLRVRVAYRFRVKTNTYYLTVRISEYYY